MRGKSWHNSDTIVETKDQQTFEKPSIIQKKQTEVKRKEFRGDNELTEALGEKLHCIHEIITGGPSKKYLQNRWWALGNYKYNGRNEKNFSGVFGL